MVGHIPAVGTPLKRYLSKYESAQTVISAIISSLEQGRDQLLRDCITLSEDQKQMREMGGGLQFANSRDIRCLDHVPECSEFKSCRTCLMRKKLRIPTRLKVYRNSIDKPFRCILPIQVVYANLCYTVLFPSIDEQPTY